MRGVRCKHHKQEPKKKEEKREAVGKRQRKEKEKRFLSSQTSLGCFGQIDYKDENSKYRNWGRVGVMTGTINELAGARENNIHSGNERCNTSKW